MDAVITGRGVVSAAGCDLDELRDKLASGWLPPRVNTFPTATGAQPTPDYFAIGQDGWKAPQGLRTKDFFTQVAAAAVAAAIEEAAIEPELPDIGMVFGTVFGPAAASQAYLRRIRDRGAVGVSPALFLDSIISTPAGFVSICFGIRGSIAVVNGTHPLEAARLWLATGRERAVILVAAETLSPTVLEGIGWLGETDSEGRSWPVLGQGAFALVLESREQAERRGIRRLATIRAMASGLGASQREDRWALSQERAEAIICAALDSAGMTPDTIAGVLSSSNGLHEFDGAEARIVERLAGDAETLRPKALFGDTLGASGLASLLYCTLLIERLGTADHGSAAAFLVNDYEAGGQYSAVVVEGDQCGR